MDGSKEQEGPVSGETPNIGGVIEVVGLRRADRKRPVERGETRSFVAQWGGAVNALDEARGLLVFMQC